MGSRARCLVRGLKTRMQQQSPEISLRCLSDTMVRLIGRRGFEDIQRCVVGVPAAGLIPRSRDISSRASSDSSSRPAAFEKHGGASERELSFADLLEDAHGVHTGPDNRSHDEGITKMVAKVGRWWYATCYETSLLAATDDKSIWADQALLR
ncbi:hypothetical protein LTR53_019047, partial [Teratosphaeriaceae sp. CCFEE 6253]